jgi:hypothetical protein
MIVDEVFNGHLYVVTSNVPSPGTVQGFQVFRSSDGESWERVVEDGFAQGGDKNVQCDLQEHDGRLYLATSNRDKRIMAMPPMETNAPYGFQLWVSDDGLAWSKAIEDGFGDNYNFIGRLSEHRGILFLSVLNYKSGNEFWWSKDGYDWERTFKQIEGRLYMWGAGPFYCGQHVYYCIFDLENGLEIWRS